MNRCIADCPMLMKEWHSVKNQNCDPTTIAFCSHKKVWWICSMNHEWEAVCKNRTLAKSGCPYCAGQRVTKQNCLAKIRPDLAKQFHPNKNTNLTPYDIAVKSSKKIWWICDQQHEWSESPNVRAKFGCPFCSNKRTCKDNCIATTHPQIVKEWHPKKNKLTPYDITVGSNKKIWWQCFKGHEWIISPHLRVKKINEICGCPICKESKGERKISEILTKHNIVFTKQYRFKDCVNKHTLPFDFALHLDKKIAVIEYQGIQHFVPKGFGGNAEENFHLLKINDKIKYKYCLYHNIPYLAIEYTQFEDMDNLISIFHKELN